MKTALLLLSSVFLSSLLSAPLLASSSPPMSSLSTLLSLLVRTATSCLTPLMSSSSSPLRATTAPSFLTLFTQKKKKLNDATSPPGLLSQVSMSPTTEKKLAFDLTSKNELQHYEIDWLNPLVILSESIRYLKKNEILPNTHESQLSFIKLSCLFQTQLVRLDTQLPSYVTPCLRVKIRSYQGLFNWYCLS